MEWRVKIGEVEKWRRGEVEKTPPRLNRKDAKNAKEAQRRTLFLAMVR